MVALRLLVAGALLILVALAAVEEFVPQGLWDQNLSGQALDIVDDAIWALLLTPIIIAIYRFVIQDGITSGYTLPLGDPVSQKVFVWLFALKVLSGLPFDLLGVMQMLGWPLWARTLGFVVTLVAAIGLSLRLAILLPALAVQAPAATAAHALADSRGQVLRLFAIFFLALIPWVAVSIGGSVLLGRRYRGRRVAADDDWAADGRPYTNNRADAFRSHYQPRFSSARRRSQSRAKTYTGTSDQAVSAWIESRHRR